MSSPSSQDGASGWVLKFVPFRCTVDSPFWVRYNQEKLERIQLNEDPIEIVATYGVDGPPRLQCQESSLLASATVPNERIQVPGSLIGYNTVESFQTVDKNRLLRDVHCQAFLPSTSDGRTRLLLLTFADLKNHRVLYWFGMPAFLNKPGTLRAYQQDLLKTVWSHDDCLLLGQQVQHLQMTANNTGMPPFFVRTPQTIVPLQESTNEVREDETAVFGFFDPIGPCSTLQPEQPMGWPLRNLVAYLAFHANMGGKTVSILSLRPNTLRRISVEPTSHSEMEVGDSILLRVRIPTKQEYEWEPTDPDDPNSCYKVVGWELNARSKPGPRWVNLRPLLDSEHLAVQAADLNLKLMKWRMIPNLNVEQLQSTKVLLIGAGTLGCNVARVLLGWGIRDLTFCDNGRVSYSNPVRQSLFTLEDCHDENGAGRYKATAAAKALEAIAADVRAKGVVLSIPMPGHAENRESIETAVNTLDELIQACDVVYLLTDTRESRWLPTVMAAAHGKILINAALGLDSWLVMRHGGSLTNANRLGCYFCNDVVAPDNSTKNRTLDQQCTVTRPGLALVASAMAVELMVSLLHHPQCQDAPAPARGASMDFSPTVSSQEEGSSPLGILPHQIRGSLVTYTMMTPTVPAFRCCTACSPAVVEAYQKDRVELTFQTCHSPDGTYLENLAGLTQFRAEAAEKMDAMLDWEDDDVDDADF